MSDLAAVDVSALSIPPDTTSDINTRPFQVRVFEWMLACFGLKISMDRVERGDRLLEEVLELLQSGGYDQDRIYALADYVYGRPVGEPEQEAGGVMVTMAAYCQAHGIEMAAAGETELDRIWTKIAAIRLKQATKPTGSALPTALVNPVTDATSSEISFMADAFGIVEATMEERHLISSANQVSNFCTWVEELAGTSAHVGSLGGRPILISINAARLNGHRFIFWHASSEVVDYKQIESWWGKNAPASCYDEHGNLRWANACNWTRLLS